MLETGQTLNIVELEITKSDDKCWFNIKKLDPPIENVDKDLEFPPKDFNSDYKGYKRQVVEEVVAEPIKAPTRAPGTPQMPTEDKVGQSVWDIKDLRMTRMNSWAHAVKIVRMTNKPEDLTEGDIYNLCEIVAHRVEGDIYR